MIARTTPHGRLLMVLRAREQKRPASRVAADFGVSERTVRKWLSRWRVGGEPALNDRSSAPARQRRLSAEQIAAIATWSTIVGTWRPGRREL
jgi:transposase